MKKLVSLILALAAALSLTGAASAQQPHHLNAVIAGHLPVHQHQIIGVAAFGGAHQFFQRGIAAVSRAGPQTHIFQLLPEYFAA